jgi:ATP-binding cassette subfamily B protein
MLKDLPNGLQQLLTNNFEAGVDLSGGQWQRVALARAFYRNAPILVLDEPTSAIDAKGEYEIFQQISKTQVDKTTIIISHRFSTVRNANHIIVFDKGSVLESGSHEELMRQTGQYHKLFELQAEGYR